MPVCKAMTGAAVQLYDMGYTLHSGGAIGADEAFATGGGARSRIYTVDDVTSAAIELAKHYHPTWHKLSMIGKSLMARNGFQVLGDDLVSPVDFVACWTPYGEVRGGTGQALRIAMDPLWNIPVFNLYYPHNYSHLLSFAIDQARKANPNV